MKWSMVYLLSCLMLLSACSDNGEDITTSPKSQCDTVTEINEAMCNARQLIIGSWEATPIINDCVEGISFLNNDTFNTTSLQEETTGHYSIDFASNQPDVLLTLLTTFDNKSLDCDGNIDDHVDGKEYAIILSFPTPDTMVFTTTTAEDTLESEVTLELRRI